jgi:hypothetical protein
MTRATLKVWLEDDCVHSRLISGSSNALYEGATPLEPCQKLASEWRSLLRGDYIDLEQQCKVGSSIAQTILPKNVYDGLTWIAGRHDGPSPIRLGVDLSGPILECLPWELLRLPSFDGDVFLALLPHSSVYRLSSPAPTNLEGKDKCRMLLAYANPGTPGFPILAPPRTRSHGFAPCLCKDPRRN